MGQKRYVTPAAYDSWVTSETFEPLATNTHAAPEQ